MRKNYLLLVSSWLALLVCLGYPSLAQQRTVTGSVTGDGTSMPGVNVLLRGTTTGTVTDVNGAYSVPVSGDNPTLIFSAIGFITEEVVVGNQSTINVDLVADIKTLSEVVVTALGVQREKKALQYSVTEVSGDNFTQARVNNVGNSLAGRIAGVNVSSPATGPAGSSRIIIRGNKTLNGQNQPLYVVDGIPMDNSNFGMAGTWAGTDQGNGMSSINPDDIESITVLKGANAAALYGSRGGNGVINIVTKRGAKKQGLGVELSSNLVFESINDQSELQEKYGTGHYASGVAVKPQNTQEAYNDADDGWGPAFDGSDVPTFDGTIRKYSNAGNNFKRFYDVGTAWTNSISLTGGDDKKSFRFGVSDLKSKGVIPNSGFDRTNVSFSTNSKIGKKLVVDAKILYSHENVKNRPLVSDSPGNATQAVWRLPANVNVENLIGDPNRPGAIPEGIDPAVLLLWGNPTLNRSKFPGLEMNPANNAWGPNPYWAAYQHDNSDKRDRILTSGSVRYNITDFLYLQGRIGMDSYTRRNRNYWPEGTHGDNIDFNAAGNSTEYFLGGSLAEGERNVRETNMEWMLGFNKTFSKIGVNAFVGGNRMRNENENLSLNSSGGFVVPFFSAINNAKNRSYTYGYGKFGVNSVFASAEVSYNNVLFLTGTARNDWFSVLNPKNNSILYPSVGASFVFSDAFEGLPDWLSFGKVRASWAQVGLANIGPYTTVSTYSLNANPHLGHQLATFSSAGNRNGVIPNPDLRPALSTETEFGLDTRILDNKVGLDLTYYSQTTTDDIFSATVSRSSGFGSSSVNLGELQNKGIEVLLSGTPVKGAITWDASLNFARNRNKVIALIEGSNSLDFEESRTQSTRIKHIVGEPFGMITGRVQAKTPDGRLIYDAQGQPVQDNGAYKILGNSVANWTGGLNNSFSYKGFNLAFLIDFKFGGEIHSGTNIRLDAWGLSERSVQGREGEAPLHITGAIANPDGTYSDVDRDLTPDEARRYWGNLGPRAGENYIYDAGFGKLRQLTLGYSVPRKILTKTPFQDITISFVGRNLAVLWKHIPNVDPESGYSANSGAQGLEYFAMLATRSYGFDLRAKF